MPRSNGRPFNRRAKLFKTVCQVSGLPTTADVRHKVNGVYVANLAVIRIPRRAS